MFPIDREDMNSFIYEGDYDIKEFFSSVNSKINYHLKMEQNEHDDILSNENISDGLVDDLY